MRKSTITKAFVIMVLLILLSFSIRASIFATIGVKGLSFASPDVAGVVQNVMKAYQITIDPSGFITGEMTGKITGEIMGEIAKQSPEAAKAIQQYQQVDGWVKEGAKITEDLKLDDKGRQAGGSIELNKKQNVESITDKKISEVENMKLSSDGEGKPYQLKASENGASAIISGNAFSNLQKDSAITVNRETGKIDEMDATFTAATTIKVNEDEIKVPEGARVVYKDGKYEVYGKDQTVEINKQKIQINGENSINYDGKKITGKDFTYDEKRFTGIGDEPAEMTPVKEGYLLGKNTKMEDSMMTITSEKGNTLYSKMCGSVSGFDNYVNPCSRKLTIEGDGFSVGLKEGKQFGLNIEKGDILKYDMEGGKVILDNGKQSIYLDEGESVNMINGGKSERYIMVNGDKLILADPDTLGEDYDVAMSTELAPRPGDEDYIMAVQNEQEDLQVENADENIYVCESSGDSSSFEIIPEVEAQACKLGATQAPNPKIKFGSAKAGQVWGEETIKGIYKNKNDPSTLEIHTEIKGEIQIYKAYFDKSGNPVYEKKVLGEYTGAAENIASLNADEVAWFGLKPATVSKEVQVTDSVYFKTIKRKTNLFDSKNYE